MTFSRRRATGLATHVLTLCLAWAVLVLPAHADDLGELLERYRGWRGGAAFEQARTLAMEGTITNSGLNGSIRVVATARGDLRRDIDLGVVRSGDARLGASGWSLTQSGQVEELAPRVSEDLRRDALLLFDSLLDDPARLALGPPVERDGRQFAVVRVDFGDADLTELYLDPRTGALYGLRTVRDRAEGFLRYSDWRMVDGVRMPFRQSETREGESATEVAWTKIRLNPRLGADAFARPVLPANHVFAGGVRTTGPMPFEFTGGTRIFIPATVGGAATEVLLDSGAEMTVLDQTFARSLGLKLEGEVVISGTGGVAGGHFARGVDITLGALTFRDLTVLVIDLEALGATGSSIGRPLRVILGKDAFNAMVVDIDFPQRRVAFTEREGFTPPAGAREIELASTGDIRAVRVSLEGRPSEWVDFDTGNGGALMVFPGYAEANGLLDGRPSTTVVAGGVGGARESTLATIRRVEIAGFAMADVPTVFPPAGASAVDSDRTVGNIGLGILGRFRLITDFGRGRAWLAGDPAALSRPFSRDRLGLAFSREGGVIVVDRVSPRSPAAEAGWASGDRIVSIDGVAGSDLTPEQLREVRMGPPGREVRFTIESGAVRVLRSRDYY